MKVNAPEKIYVQMSRYWYGIDSLFYHVRQHKNDTEYIRTDSFIEKATLWLQTNVSDYCILHNSYDTKGLVKDFVDAMKRD